VRCGAGEQQRRIPTFGSLGSRGVGAVGREALLFFLGGIFLEAPPGLISMRFGDFDRVPPCEEVFCVGLYTDFVLGLLFSP